MPLYRAPFKIRMVGRSTDHPRYIVRDDRRLIDHYHTGRGWSRRIQDARLYHDPELAGETAKRLTLKHLRRHEPKRLYLLTLVFRVHAPEDVSRHDVETYLKNAMVVGLDHRKYGTGPTETSLVEVVVPVISLAEGR